MKKIAIALLATCTFMACGNSQKPKQQSADSVTVKQTQQDDQDTPPQTRVMTVGDDISFDLGTGVLTIRGVRYEFAYVKPGTFTMGATADMKDADGNERPAHKVTLTQGYYIGKTPVTWAFWKTVMGSYPSDAEGQGMANEASKHPDNEPVNNISWKQAQSFAISLGAEFGECAEFRLPTEAEWEFAARGGNKSKGYKYSGSNTIADVAWFADNTENGPHPVAKKQPNELGLFDMSGNVWEWCSDVYAPYTTKAQTDPRGPEGLGESYVLRGGNCFVDANNCRVTARYMDSPDNDDNPFYGLRIVYVEGTGH